MEKLPSGNAWENVLDHLDPIRLGGSQESRGAKNRKGLAERGGVVGGVRWLGRPGASGKTPSENLKARGKEARRIVQLFHRKRKKISQLWKRPLCREGSVGECLGKFSDMIWGGGAVGV